MNSSTVPLQKICKFISGGTPSKKNSAYFKGTMPWITGADIKDNVFYKAREHITDEAIQNSATKIVPKGNLLLVTRTGVGKVAVAGVDVCISQDFTGLQLNHDKVDKWYLFYFLRSQKENLISQQRGATIQGITRDVVENIQVPLPPLPEQKRIAAQLAQADRLRQLRRSASQLGESYLQSAFLKMFGDVSTNSKKWKTLKAGEVFEIKLGKMLSEKNYKGTHLKPYLRNFNVQWGHINFSDIKKMDFDEKEFDKYKLQSGDILVCEGGEVGRTAIYYGEINNCCYQNALHRLRIIKPIIEPVYFVEFMKAAARTGLIAKRTSQVTIAHFTAEKFKEFDVMLPPLPEQERFAQIVARHERLRSQMRESQRQAEILFQGLLYESFGG